MIEEAMIEGKSTSSFIRNRPTKVGKLIGLVVGKRGAKFVGDNRKG
jgi:hypothetical protein